MFVGCIYLFVFSAPWFIYCTIEKLKTNLKKPVDIKPEKKAIFFHLVCFSMGIIESKWWTFNLCISSLTHVLSWTEHIHFTGYKCIWPRPSTRAHQSDIQSIDLNIHAINTSNHHQMAGMVVFSSRFSRAAKFDASATINFGHSFRFWCKQCTDIQNDCFYFIWLFWKGIIDTVFYQLHFVVFSLKCIPIKGLFEIVFFPLLLF